MKMWTNVFTAFLLVGCSGGATGGGGGDQQQHTPPPTPPPTPAEINARARQDLASCRSGVGDAAFDDAIEITTDFDLSSREMMECGGAQVALSVGIVARILDEALGTGTGDVALKFDGKSAYKTSSLGATMTVEIRLHRDTSFGKKGDVVPFDLLDIATYFVGGHITGTATVTNGKPSVDVAVSYSALGPGFELLGLTASPSPMKLDVDHLQSELGQLLMHATTHVDDTQGHGKFTYDMPSTDKTIADVQSSSLVSFTNTAFAGGRADTSQTMSVISWQADSIGSHSANGTIEANVTGGALPYKVKLAYANAPHATISFSCP
jgi:hypothetical protein